ncbi:MAG: helix-turn-helix transcriptional regulator, partial [Cytophagales bacterium]|nr:helix-turn-helix transcriptional regulator [Armatimonadota bacterium]
WNARDVQSTFWRFYRNEDPGAYLDLPDGARFAIEAGKSYLVPAGVRFSCGNVGTAVRHFYIHFDLVGLPHLTLRHLFSGPVLVQADDAFTARIAEFTAATREARPPGFTDQCRAKALIYEGLAHYLDRIGPEAHAESLRQAAALEPVTPALDYLESHLGERLTTAHLAALCCLSEDHFARRFRECVGQTPGAYITERRVTRAAQRLLFTADSLEAIAEGCGFGNRSYLTRVFSRSTGMPPAAYRKSDRW